MADKKGKPMNISFSADQIIGADITRSGEYKYASVGIKLGDKEFIRISYEWAGEGIPDFVMGLQGWMGANKEVIDATKEAAKEEYASIKERVSKI
ncbi:MAG: hypothetical protein WC346_15435 [Methanogenium sp.]|jgi:hypothetical protein